MTFLSDLISVMTKIRLSWVIKAGIFQLLFVTIANIVLSEFFYFILDVTGQYHLDKDNVVTFLKNPIALALYPIDYSSLTYWFIFCDYSKALSSRIYCWGIIKDN